MTKDVYYKGVCMSTMQRAGKKAAETRSKNAQKLLYGNREKKKEIHTVIEALVSKYISPYYTCNIFSLETHEYTLPNILKANCEFFIAQKDKAEFLKMLKTKPSNVPLLHCGCISDFCYLNIEPDFIFFDFCNTLVKNKEIYQKLSDKIENCVMLFVTACLRNAKKDISDSKFDMANKLLKYFPNYKLIEATAYKDKEHAPMITFFLENKNPRKNLSSGYSNNGGK